MRRKRQREAAKLNITSLLDMFTIMLLFLLVNFSAKQENTKIHPGLALPHSEAELDAVDAIDVVLTKEKLLLEDKVVVKLKHGRFSRDYMDGDKIKPFYSALVRLKKRYDRQRKLASVKKGKNGKKKDKNKQVILFQSDKTIAFNTVDKVMMTTAQAGFPNFKFAVLQKPR